MVFACSGAFLISFNSLHRMESFICFKMLKGGSHPFGLNCMFLFKGADNFLYNLIEYSPAFCIGYIAFHVLPNIWRIFAQV